MLDFGQFFKNKGLELQRQTVKARVKDEVRANSFLILGSLAFMTYLCNSRIVFFKNRLQGLASESLRYLQKYLVSVKNIILYGISKTRKQVINLK